ncbi:hypothetical protein [Boudabousia marimammalium]|uniref:Protein kinase domain-containing protein n=1 Tax=Boudabousia marimammalium TaxID=156892 RepID=A0A1Q5PQY8_9ACTO|nr:hypothetical protein [Boudabousia marimammalium]OKL50058.1 hypothetical protein BM477_04010 [Boudabousia marimammalium]
MLSENGQIYERLKILDECDSAGFRAFVRFLHLHPQKALPLIVAFFREQQQTVLITDSHEGISLRAYLSATEVRPDELDSLWNQLNETLKLLHRNDFSLGTLNIDDVLVDKHGEIRLSLYSLSQSPGGEQLARGGDIARDIADLGRLEQIIRDTLQGEPVEAPETTDFSAAATSIRASTTAAKTPMRKAPWLAAAALGLGGLLSGAVWLADTYFTPSPNHDIAADMSSTTESHSTVELDWGVPESTIEHYENALDIINTPVSIDAVTDETASRVIGALALLRDDAINQLKQAEYQALTVVGSSAAKVENGLFQALIKDGNRVQGYRTTYEDVQIAARGADWIEVTAMISQSEHLRCAQECVEIARLPARQVRLRLVPSPWRLSEIASE